MAQAPPDFRFRSGPFSQYLRQSAGLYCAAYYSTPPLNPLISLILQKIAHF